MEIDFTSFLWRLNVEFKLRDSALYDIILWCNCNTLYYDEKNSMP